MRRIERSVVSAILFSLFLTACGGYSGKSLVCPDGYEKFADQDGVTACKTTVTNTVDVDHDCRDKGCAEGTCNRATGVCETTIELPSCTSNADCADGDTCDVVANRCVHTVTNTVEVPTPQACSSTNPCEMGTCGEDGYCHIYGECTDNSQCPEGAVCTDGTCLLTEVNSCTSDMDCALGGGTCNLENGFCMYPVSCTDVDCPANYVCDTNTGLCNERQAPPAPEVIITYSGVNSSTRRTEVIVEANHSRGFNNLTVVCTDSTGRTLRTYGPQSNLFGVHFTLENLLPDPVINSCTASGDDLDTGIHVTRTRSFSYIAEPVPPDPCQITATVHPSSMLPSGILVSGTTGNKVAAYQFRSTNVGCTITGFPVGLNDPSLEHDIWVVTVGYIDRSGNAVTAQRALYNGAALFNVGSLDIPLPKNTDVVVWIAADLATEVSGDAVDGDVFKLGIKTSGTVGATSNGTFTDDFTAVSDAGVPSYGTAVTITDTSLPSFEIRQTNVTAATNGTQQQGDRPPSAESLIGSVNFLSFAEPGSFRYSTLENVALKLRGNLIGTGVGDNTVTICAYDSVMYSSQYLMGCTNITNVDAMTSDTVTLALTAHNMLWDGQQKTVYFVVDTNDSDFALDWTAPKMLAVDIVSYSWDDEAESGVTSPADQSGVVLRGLDYRFF